MNDSKTNLSNTLDATLKRYTDAMGEPLGIFPELQSIDTPHFIALAEPINEGVRLHISDGVNEAMSKIWHQAIGYSAQLPDEESLNVSDAEEAIEYSLQWLMLHELHHYQMGHFKLTGGMGLSETSNAYAMGLTSRDVHIPCLIDNLRKDQQPLALRCMEMQADHDSTEMMLGRYSTENWGILRFYAACIFVVMVAIEKEGRTQLDDEARGYPKAATRIFQFIGHLAVMWSVPARSKAHKNGWDAIREEDLPSVKEREAFQAQVVVPALSDAILIAKANNAQSVLNEMGSIEDFIEDIARIHEMTEASIAELKTVGAKEYAALAPLNEKVLELLEIDPFNA